MFELIEAKKYPVGLYQLRQYRFKNGLLSFAGPEGHSTGPSVDRFCHKDDWCCRRRLGGVFYTTHMSAAILSCVVCSNVKNRKEFLENIIISSQILSREFENSAKLSRQFIMAAYSARNVILGNKPISLIEALVKTFQGK